MNQESTSSSGKEHSNTLIEKFEKMVSEKQSYYFDVDQCEYILEYYLEHNNIEQALAILQHVEGIFPTSTIIKLRKAQVLAGIGSTHDAIQILKGLILLEPTNEEIHLTLASIYSQLRDHTEALRCFRTALGLVEDDFQIDIYLDMALEYESMGGFGNAIDVLKKALIINPKHEIVLNELAFCFDASNKIEEGISFFENLINLHPYLVFAWHNLGNFHTRNGDFEKAINDYDFCVAIEEEYLPAYVNKANVYVELEKYEEAIESLQEFMEFDSADPGVYCFLAECYEKMGRYDEAIENYWESLTIDEDYSEAYIGLSVVSQLQENFQDSLDWMQKALALHPMSVDHQILTAGCLHRAGYDFEAISMYRHITDSDGSNISAWLDYTDYLSSSGRLFEAIETLDYAIDKNPEETSLFLRKVAYLHREGFLRESLNLMSDLIQKGISDFQEIIEYYPDLKNDSDFTKLIGINKAK